VEAKECFLLYTSPACFSIIPKRVLQPAELDDLRQLLKMNVGKTAAVAVS
jgi:YcxB-like protein